jgi:hypothetical protein
VEHGTLSTPNSSNTNDSNQCFFGTYAGYSPAIGVDFKILGFTMRTYAPNYGATYSNGSATWLISQDSIITVNIRKAGANYYAVFYKHPLSSGLTTTKTAGTFLYMEQISASFFPASGSTQGAIYVRFKR